AAEKPSKPLTAQTDAQTSHIVWSDRGAKSSKPRSIRDIKSEILSRARTTSKPTGRQHLQSLIFGFGVGGFVILLLLFGFFNERFIAPFITPSRAVSSTPIIIDPNSTAAGPNPEVIIPKINVELPVVFDEKSSDENAIESALESGVVHYPTTSYPGE